MCVAAYSARLIDGEIRDYEAPSGVPSLNPCSVTTTRTFVVVDSNEIRNGGRLCSWKIIVKPNSMSAPDILALRTRVQRRFYGAYEYDAYR